MKRFILTFFSLSAATATFCWSHQITAFQQQEAAARQLDWLAASNRLNVAGVQKQTLQDRNHQLKLQLADAAQDASGKKQLAGFSVPQPGALSPEQSEQLLAALGFSWNASSNYIVVSKQTVSNICFAAIHDEKLTRAALGVLAISPDEQAGLEDLLARVHGQYVSWLTNHAQKVPPGSNEVLHIELPPDPDFFGSLSNAFVSGVVDILGAERGDSLANFSLDWMNDHSLGFTKNATFTVAVRGTGNKDPSGRTNYDYEFRAEQTVDTEVMHGTAGFYSRLIRPEEPVPAFIQPLFPGGWREIAQREGFELSRYIFPVTNVAK